MDLQMEQASHMNHNIRNTTTNNNNKNKNISNSNNVKM